ncbi:uncharacterized protein (DUF58 family) [Methanolinea mesophila]|uniref:DUF58 domain-containing protein n=1 Tax=Methanolinea mesophila TaxID=547055 RepID=UPI001AE52D66|nr:DUF58 domain-containing protein [Methanolinea mesophila]MBP1928153.1 uncharacterized protein (DUF58 family) [Methanolinea mesophila]
MQDATSPGDRSSKRSRRFRRLERAMIPMDLRSSGLAAGVHRSTFKGHGIEFSDLREYVPGDDLRAIDWKVTARLDQPFTRLLTEERDLTLCLVVDISGSTGFGSLASKVDTAREIAGSLAVSALRHHDAVGLMLFSDGVEKYVPPGKGRRHVLEVLNTLFEHTPVSGRSDIAPALRHLAHSLARQSSVILISDFLLPPCRRELAVMKKRHQVFAIRISDPREEEIPDVGYLTLEDTETGEQLVIDTSDTLAMARYRESFREREESLVRALGTFGIPLARVRTGDGWEPGLRRFFRG